MSSETPDRPPAFIDAHVHIKDVAGLDAVRAAGIVAVRDCGFKPDISGGMRMVIPPHDGPRVVSAGWALCKPGGYGTSFGRAVEGQAALAAEIVRLVQAGVAIIKVMAAGIVSLRVPGTITAGGFSGTELANIVQEADRHGLGVMAHANGEQAIIAAAHAGVRSIEHGFFMTPAALEAMASRGIFWVPTAGALCRAAEGAAVPPEAKRFVHSLLQSHLAMIKTAYDLGVPLAVGTDCVLPHGDYRGAYRTELEYFEQAGIPRSGVLLLATEGGAKLLRLEDEYGRKHQA